MLEQRNTYIYLNCINKLVVVKVIQCALLEAQAEFVIFRELISGLKRLEHLHLDNTIAPCFTATILIASK
jgi:hypothetical protein